MKKNFINSEIESHSLITNSLYGLSPKIEQVANIIISSIEKKNKIFLMGNGGSAADAQHIAAEFVGRFKNKRSGLPAIALTTDSSVMSSISNDFNFDYVFQRQIEALTNEGDVVIGISTSGNSTNVINGLVQAKEKNNIVIGLTGGNGGKMNQLCQLNIIVPSDETPRIQEMHILIGHILCAIVDNHFSNQKTF